MTTTTNNNNTTTTNKKITKIDCYTHWASPKLLAYMRGVTGKPAPFQALFDRIPILTCGSEEHLRDRLAHMDAAGVVCQVLIPLPWIEACPAIWKDPEKASRACRIANEEMAEFCATVPGRFLGVALLPTVNGEVLLREYRHAVDRLGLVGSVLFVGPNGIPPDDGRFEALYRESNARGTPLWLHPSRPQSTPDYAAYSDRGSLHAIWNSLGWIYDTSVAMVHIALSGVLQRYPDLKIVGHHGGGMIPFFTERFEVQLSNFGADREADKFLDLRKFYCDTATFGFQPTNIRQCLDFFDPGRVLYGTDTPMDMSSPGMFMETAGKSIDHLQLTDRDHSAVCYGNALGMLGVHGNPVRALLGVQELRKTAAPGAGGSGSGDPKRGGVRNHSTSSSTLPASLPENLLFHLLHEMREGYPKVRPDSRL